MKDLIEALTIFLKYADEHCPTDCEHDELTIANISYDEVSEEDRDRLSEIDFEWSDENGCWTSFRFGRA